MLNLGRAPLSDDPLFCLLICMQRPEACVGSTTYRMVLLMDAYIACRGDNRNDWRSHIPTKSDKAIRRQLMRWNPEFFNQFSYIPGRGCGGFIPAW